jgi:hypothetical protein
LKLFFVSNHSASKIVKVTGCWLPFTGYWLPFTVSPLPTSLFPFFSIFFFQKFTIFSVQTNLNETKSIFSPVFSPCVSY